MPCYPAMLPMMWMPPSGMVPMDHMVRVFYVFPLFRAPKCKVSVLFLLYNGCLNFRGANLSSQFVLQWNTNYVASSVECMVLLIPFQNYQSQGGYPNNMPDYQEMEDHRYRLLIMSYFLLFFSVSICIYCTKFWNLIWIHRVDCKF